MRTGANATQGEFAEQRALINFLEESCPEGVGDFKRGTKHALGQGSECWLFILVQIRRCVRGREVLTQVVGDLSGLGDCYPAADERG